MASIAFLFALTIAPASAETLTCSTWQGMRTCSDAHGYVSRESEWQGMKIGSDNEGNRWTTSEWQDREITTVTPGRRR
jgi:hypothetical protein